MTVILKDGKRVEASYVRHLRTLTAGNSLGGGSQDVDEVELADGRRIAVQSPENDSRVTPRECGVPADYK